MREGLRALIERDSARRLAFGALKQRRDEGNSFVSHVLEQDKIWVIGGEDEIESD